MTTLRIPTDFTDAGWEKFKKAYEITAKEGIPTCISESRRAWFDDFDRAWQNHEDLCIEISQFSTKSGHTEMLRDMDKEDFEWEDVQCDDEE
jgi:hypothetical protein